MWKKPSKKDNPGAVALVTAPAQREAKRENKTELSPHRLAKSRTSRVQDGKKLSSPDSTIETYGHRNKTGGKIKKQHKNTAPSGNQLCRKAKTPARRSRDSEKEGGVAASGGRATGPPRRAGGRSGRQRHGAQARGRPTSGPASRADRGEHPARADRRPQAGPRPGQGPPKQQRAQARTSRAAGTHIHNKTRKKLKEN